jgi:hypothetical protein
LDVDSVGVYSLSILDPYLILHTWNLPDFAKIYNVNTLEYFGDFFQRGQGPDDFLQFEIVKQEFPYIYVNDMQNKQLNVVNLQKTLIDNKTCIEKKWNYRKMIDPLLSFYKDDTCLLIKNINWREKTLNYVLYNPVTETIINEFTPLYAFPIIDEIRNGMGTTADRMKPDGSKIVSLSFIADQIDVFDVEKWMGFSVTTSNEDFDYEHIVNTLPDERKKYYYGLPVCSNEYIFVLYYNHKSEDDHKHEIHVIDWEGNPKFKLILDYGIIAISVDFENSVLYGIRGGDDNVFRYDIKAIMDKYK